MKSIDKPVLLVTPSHDIAFNLSQWLEIMEIPLEYTSSSAEADPLLKDSEAPFSLIIYDLALQEENPINLTSLDVPLAAIAAAHNESPLDLNLFSVVFPRKMEEETLISWLGKTFTIKNEDERLKEKLIYNRDNAMTIIGDDVEILKIGLETFVEDTPHTFEALVNHLKEGNFIKARHCCHAIEGASATIGAEALDGQLKKLHRYLREENLNASQEMIELLESTYRRLLSVLKEELVRID